MTTRIDKKQTRTHNRNTTQAETQKKEELEQRRQRIQRMQAQETSWTEKKVVCQTPNTKKNKYEATKNPLLPQKIVQEHETKTCSVDERNPPQKKETMILWKDIFAKDPPIGKQNYLFFSPVLSCSNARGGGWEKKKHKLRKEEE